MVPWLFIWFESRRRPRAFLEGQDKFGVGALGIDPVATRKISAASPPRMTDCVAGKPRGPAAGSGRATESPVGNPAPSDRLLVDRLDHITGAQLPPADLRAHLRDHHPADIRAAHPAAALVAESIPALRWNQGRHSVTAAPAVIRVRFVRRRCAVARAHPAGARAPVHNWPAASLIFAESVTGLPLRATCTSTFLSSSACETNRRNSVMLRTSCPSNF